MRLKIIKDKQDKKDKERKGNEYEEVREKLIQMIGVNVIHCSINMNKKKFVYIKRQRNKLGQAQFKLGLTKPALLSKELGLS